MSFQYRTCNKCGWVHFTVTRKHAENEVARFREFYNSLSKEDQDEFYGGEPSCIEMYERCFVCSNPHTNFRVSEPGDLPNGSTVSPIIYEIIYEESES